MYKADPCTCQGNYTAISLCSHAIAWCDVSVFDTDGARSLTVVVDGVGDDGVKRSGVVAVLILQENLNAQANHIQVVLLCLQQLLPWHYDKTHIS